jgi:lambda repressor-like predicted transcriptional regulator
MTPIKTPLPNRDSITRAQLESLLSTAATMGGLLFQIQGLDEQNGGILDGGAKSAVEATLINVCNRIDTLMEEKDRWSMVHQDTLEATLTKMYDQNTQLIAKQVAIHEEALAPHSRYRPSLRKLPDGMWIAILGTVEDLENALIGIGDCPAKAIKAFDMLFEGHLPAHILEWMTQRETAFQNDQLPPELPKQKTHEQESAVDGTGNLPAQGTESSQSPPARNRRNTRKNRPSGGTAS